VSEAMPRWVAIPDPSAYARLVGAEAADEAGVSRSPRADASVNVVTCDGAVSPGWEGAWHDRFEPTFVGACRDADYLRRRYLDHPRFRYEVAFALDGVASPVGLSVYRVERERDSAIPAVRIVELLGEPEVQQALAERILDEATRVGAAFADFYCTSVGAGAGLERAGFVPERFFGRTIPSRLQPYDPSRTSLSVALRLGDVDIDEVYVTRSDCDQDRPT
jgi:hypothetical protein